MKVKLFCNSGIIDYPEIRYGIVGYQLSVFTDILHLILQKKKRMLNIDIFIKLCTLVVHKIISSYKTYLMILFSETQVENTYLNFLIIVICLLVTYNTFHIIYLHKKEKWENARKTIN